MSAPIISLSGKFDSNAVLILKMTPTLRTIIDGYSILLNLLIYSSFISTSFSVILSWRELYY